ncbi:MAG: GTPase [Actinomycetota bacterium]
MSQQLVDLADALSRRVDTAPNPGTKDRADRLRQHVREYLVPRAANLAAPLVVVLLGSTGAGKSSLFNAMAGGRASESGLLRPTTRRPVALVHPQDVAAVSEDGLVSGSSADGLLEIITDPAITPGLIIVDAPDFDSVVTSNRVVATELLEAADLVVFVTTVTRYADQVPWSVLARARQRGVPLMMVLNRMPANSPEAGAVLADFRALLDRGELDGQGAFGTLEVVVVAEGALEPEIDGLDRGAVRPILEALTALRADGEKRKNLARRSLNSALRGLPDAVEAIAAEIDQEQKASALLIKELERSYRRGRLALGREMETGSFLRNEVLRQWLDFVNAGPVARFLSEGVGRLAAGLRNLLRPSPPLPTPAIQQAAFTDLVASAVRHADDCARETAMVWGENPYGALAVASSPTLWGATPDLGIRLQRDLEGWEEYLGSEIRSLGAQRRGRALAASVGLNVLATSAMLAVFLHTGGLTGAELGIGAAAAVINQKLLETIFGEANVAGFVSRGRAHLAGIFDQRFADERERYLVALGPLAERTDLADRLRGLAHQAARSVAQ